MNPAALAVSSASSSSPGAASSMPSSTRSWNRSPSTDAAVSVVQAAVPQAGNTCADEVADRGGHEVEMCAARRRHVACELTDEVRVAARTTSDERSVAGRRARVLVRSDELLDLTRLEAMELEALHVALPPQRRDRFRER